MTHADLNIPSIELDIDDVNTHCRLMAEYRVPAQRRLLKYLSSDRFANFITDYNPDHNRLWEFLIEDRQDSDRDEQGDESALVKFLNMGFQRRTNHAVNGIREIVTKSKYMALTKYLLDEFAIALSDAGYPCRVVNNCHGGCFELNYYGYILVL